MMRLAAAALLALALAGGALAGGPRGTWSGTWQNPAMGTSGTARLVEGKAPELRLAGAALGCAGTTVLQVRYTRGRLWGSGRDVDCNRGLRWSLSARARGSMLAGTLRLRLADGSRAALLLVLRR